MDKKQWIKLIIAGVVVLALVLGLSGLFTGGKLMYRLKNRGELGPLDRSDIEYKDVEAPEATSSDGTVNASD